MNQTAQTRPGAALSVRSQTSQLITSVATTTGETKEAILSRIYSRLHLHYGVDLAKLPRTSNEDLLTVAERFGWLDLLYSFAYAEHLYQLAFEE